MRHTFNAGIIGAAGADEVTAQALVAKIVLELLKWPLQQERYKTMSDRNKTLQGQSSRHADHALLHDAQVEDALVRLKTRGADVRENNDQALILFEHGAECLYHMCTHISHFASSRTARFPL